MDFKKFCEVATVITLTSRILTALDAHQSDAEEKTRSALIAIQKNMKEKRVGPAEFHKIVQERFLAGIRMQL